MFDEREPAEPELTPDLQAIEGRLARLTPAGARIDRDRLMFEAGMAAARPSRLGRLAVARWPGYIAGPSWHGGLVWPAITTLMTAASLLLAVSLVWQRHSFEVALQQSHEPNISAQVAAQSRGEAAEPNTLPVANIGRWNMLPQSLNGYLAVRYITLMRGVDAIDVDDGFGTADTHLSARSNGRDSKHESTPTDVHTLNPRSTVF